MKKLIYFTMLLGAVLALASCNKDPKGPEKLETPVLTQEILEDNGSCTISWEEIVGAGSYAYVIDDGEQETTEELSVKFENLSDGEHIVEVKALAKDESYIDSEWGKKVFSTTDRRLPTPTNLALGEQTPETFIVGWGGNTNAEKYEYTVNDGEVKVSERTTATIPYSEYGEYTFRVRSIAKKDSGKLDSDWATKTFDISKPKIEIPDVGYRGFSDNPNVTEVIFGWDPIDNAIKYRYQKVTNSFVPISEIEETDELTVLLVGGEYITVQAVADPDGPWGDSEWSYPVGVDTASGQM